MTEQTSNSAAVAKPLPYEYTREWTKSDGSVCQGDIPADVSGIRFTDKEGAFDVSFSSVGVSGSGLMLTLAAFAVMQICNSALGTVPSVAGKKDETRSYSEIARALIANRVTKIAEAKIAGIRTGESSIPVFNLVLARMFNVDQEEVSRRLAAKKASFATDEEFKTWASEVRAAPKYKTAKAELDLERAKGDSSAAEVEF